MYDDLQNKDYKKYIFKCYMIVNYFLVIIISTIFFMVRY